MRSNPSTQPAAQLAGICDSVSAEAANPLKRASSRDGWKSAGSGWPTRLNNPRCYFNEVLNLRLNPLAVAALFYMVLGRWLSAPAMTIVSLLQFSRERIVLNW